MPVEIVTGDDVALPVTLKKDNQTFVIDPGATVTAALVSTNHKQKHTADIAQSDAAPGADWANSLVVIEISAAVTALLTDYGPALIEIEVDDNGKLTWFAHVDIVQGQVN